jgi:hypothetical protein
MDISNRFVLDRIDWYKRYEIRGIKLSNWRIVSLGSGSYTVNELKGSQRTVPLKAPVSRAHPGHC